VIGSDVYELDVLVGVEVVVGLTIVMNPEA
jgi:hypothetical protein